MNHAYRYAIYFAPRPDSPFWNAGSQWLGRCAASQLEVAQPDIRGLSPQSFFQITAAPRRYGWHATLKAPFSLAPGVTGSVLMDAVRNIGQQLEPFTIPHLQVTREDDFLALTLTAHSRQMRALERQCVSALHPLAAPLSNDELLRRRLAHLNPEQDALLLRWGYPYVYEYFKFHISLTGSLSACSEPQIQSLMDVANEFFADANSISIDSIAVFAEPVKGENFVLLDHIGLGN
jgi:putative phosphonate metabolism protein